MMIGVSARSRRMSSGPNAASGALTTPGRFWPDGAQLHHVTVPHWTLLRPRAGFVLTPTLDQIVAADHLARLRVRTVDQPAFAIFLTIAPRLAARAKTVSGHVHPGRFQLRRERRVL